MQTTGFEVGLKGRNEEDGTFQKEKSGSQNEEVADAILYLWA